jgi:hypothetical protein
MRGMGPGTNEHQRRTQGRESHRRTGIRATTRGDLAISLHGERARENVGEAFVLRTGQSIGARRPTARQSSRDRIGKASPASKAAETEARSFSSSVSRKWLATISDGGYARGKLLPRDRKDWED